MDITERFATLTAGSAEPVEVWSRIWDASGVQPLSGRASGPPLGVPVAMVSFAHRLGAQLALISQRLGIRVGIDAVALLGERAAISGLTRHGNISCGGGSRLLATADGWIAVSLTRAADLEIVPAWLELAIATSDVELLWEVIAETVSRRACTELVGRGVLCGLACSTLGEITTAAPLVSATRHGNHPRCDDLDGVVVVDLSSLWAGPLCAHLIGLAGARIIKVESVNRPDGARNGPQAFYDLLHGGHQSVALDFSDDHDLGVLRGLLQRADVVIEASRPRALTQLGADPATIIHTPPTRSDKPGCGPQVWLSISGYGRHPNNALRAGFGDDTAIAGGLITADTNGPCFCADAVGDPLTGLLGAVTVLDRLAHGGQWHIELALASTTAWSAHGPVTQISDHPANTPRHRPITTTAAPLGQHTTTVLNEFGLLR